MRNRRVLGVQYLHSAGTVFQLRGEVKQVPADLFEDGADLGFWEASALLLVTLNHGYQTASTTVLLQQTASQWQRTPLRTIKMKYSVAFDLASTRLIQFDE